MAAKEAICPGVGTAACGFDKGCDEILAAIGRKLSELDGSLPHESIHRLKARICFRWQRELGTALFYQRRQFSRLQIHGWE